MRRNWRPVIVFIVGVLMLVGISETVIGCKATEPRKTTACKIAKKETETKKDSRGRETTEYEFDCTDGREIKVTWVTYNAYEAGQVYS